MIPLAAAYSSVREVRKKEERDTGWDDGVCGRGRSLGQRAGIF